MPYDVTLRVWRGDATGGDFVNYRVSVEEGEVVLDAVHRLQATQAGDLAVRWNCKAGKCGSCSAEINGKPALMCMTRLNALDTSEPIVVNPPRTWPVIRDLVTDVSFNYERAREVPPFTPAGDNKGGKFRMQQEDVQRMQEFRKCIECFLCQNVCHVIRDHDDNKKNFAGPRMFIRYAELDMHPLDTLDRRKMTQDHAGVGFCNITKCCTEVCPEHIHITDNGIIPLKERVVDAKYDPVVWLTDKIAVRRQHRTAVGPRVDHGPSPIKRPRGAAPTGLEPDVVLRPGQEAPPRRRAPKAEPATLPSRRGKAPAHAAPRGAAAKWGPSAAVAALGVSALVWALRRTRRR